ncbi:hypothetical protein HDE_09873 [Halotydeus destructor]|nr:hypothetical protein HDE_09873 [Halotydeus destructor]
MDTDHAGNPITYTVMRDLVPSEGSQLKGTVTTGYFYNYKMDISGIMRDVVRVGDAQVIPTDKGPVVQYVQQESRLHFTGFVNYTRAYQIENGSLTFVPITGHIQLNPITVTLEPTGGLFKVTPLPEGGRKPVQTLTVLGLTRHPMLIDSLESNMNRKFASPFSPSPFWAKVAPIEIEDRRQETWTWIQRTDWTELTDYLVQHQA